MIPSYVCQLFLKGDTHYPYTTQIIEFNAEDVLGVGKV